MEYYIFDPTGNITAIIKGPVDIKDRPQIAGEIMKQEPEVEQAGFILPGYGEYNGELQMAGGEFCGNASMSAAACIAIEKGVVSGEELQIILKVSGTPEPVKVELLAVDENSFNGRVTMPQAKEIIQVPVPDYKEVPVVVMPGIAHAIVNEEIGTDKAEKILVFLCEKLSVDAMGVMLVNDEMTKVTPIVYVPGAGTLVYEHSCASGSAAIGAYLAIKAGKRISAELTEPGGILTVEAEPTGELLIGGKVSLIKKVS